MKTRLFLISTSALLIGQLSVLRAEKEPQAPVPTVIGSQPATVPAPRPDSQKLYGPSDATLVPVEQARALVDKFRENFAKQESPRVLLYINRELVDTDSGIKLTGRTEKFAESKANGQSQKIETSGENTYTLKDGTKATLADRQTSREVERLFGRAFRAAGATLADQKVASDLLGNKPLENLTGTNDQAGKDREALLKVADIVIEVLVSSRTVNVTEVSGDKQYAAPDIQATAIRLKDAAIIGQAASTDVLGKDRSVGQVLQRFDVRDITEATALALMEDMLTGVK